MTTGTKDKEERQELPGNPDGQASQDKPSSQSSQASPAGPSKKVAIVVADGFEQVELTVPRQALLDAGFAVEIVSPKSGSTVQGYHHTEKGDAFPIDVAIGKAKSESYAALLLPGGVHNPDELRQNANTRDLIFDIPAIIESISASMTLETGDIIYSVYSAVTECFLMVLTGDPLPALCERIEVMRQFVRRRGLADQTATLGHMLHVFGRVLAGPGEPELAATLAAEDAAIRAGLDDTRTPLAMFYYHLYRAIERYLLADFAAARAAEFWPENDGPGAR